MNIGQILETHLGWAAAHGVFAERRRPERHGLEADRRDNPHPVATPVFDGATEEDVDEALVKWTRQNPDSPIKFLVDQKRPVGRRRSGKVRLFNGKTGDAVRAEGDRWLHVHPEAAAPRGRQDPRPLDRPVLARHAAAARRQGAVRRPALRRDGGVGARGLRRRVHAAGDAHDQVRRHGRAREGVRGDRQGREHRRAVDPRELQGAAEGDAVPRARRERPLGRGRRRSRSARRTTSCCVRPRSSASTCRPARSAPRRASPRPRRSRRDRSASTRTASWRCRPTRSSATSTDVEVSGRRRRQCEEECEEAEAEAPALAEGELELED